MARLLLIALVMLAVGEADDVAREASLAGSSPDDTWAASTTSTSARSPPAISMAAAAIGDALRRARAGLAQRQAPLS